MPGVDSASTRNLPRGRERVRLTTPLPSVSQLSKQWYSILFVSVPSDVISLNFVPQSCWCIIQVISSLRSTSKVNYIENNVLNNNTIQKLIKGKRYFSKAKLYDILSIIIVALTR
jgi:hypothetical protein